MEVDLGRLESAALVVELRDTCDDQDQSEMSFASAAHALFLRIVEGRPASFAGSDSGCLLWPAAQPLAQALWARRSELCIPGLTALELGCGCGLASLAVAAAGMEVLATDQDTAVLQTVTRLNLAANAEQLSAPVHLGKLRFGEAAEFDAALRTLGRPPALVFASDVLYEPELFPALAATLRGFAAAAMAAGSSFWIVLAWQDRSPATENAFLESLADVLPTRRQLHVEEVPDPFSDTGFSAVRVCQLSPSSVLHADDAPMH